MSKNTQKIVKIVNYFENNDVEGYKKFARKRLIELGFLNKDNMKKVAQNNKKRERELNISKEEKVPLNRTYKKNKKQCMIFILE